MRSSHISVSDSRVRIALKYCGSCNPQIDTSEIGNSLKEAFRKDDSLNLVAPEDSRIDVMVILCGCFRACGDTEEIRRRAPRSIVVTGEAIDMTPVAEEAISTGVIRKLKSLIDTV